MTHRSPVEESVILTVGRTISAVVGLVVPIAIVRSLEQASVGHYKQVFLVSATLQILLSIGVPASLYRFMPRFPGESQRLLERSALILAGAGIVAGLAFLSATPLLVRHLSLSDPLAIRLGALYTALALPAGLLTVAATADRRVGVATLVLGGGEIVRGVAMSTTAVVSRRLDLVLVAAVVCMALQAAAFLAYVVWRSRNGRVGVTAEPAFTVRAREQLVYSIGYQGVIVANLLREQAHFYYVATLVPAASFAVYAIGLLQVPLVSSIRQSACDVAIVRGSSLHARSATDELLALWHRLMLLAALVVVPVAVSLLVFAPELFRVLFGTAYNASASIFRLSVILLLLDTPLLHAVLRATGLTRAASRAEIASLLVLFASLPIAVRVFGPIGAVASLIVGSTVFSAVALRAIRSDLQVGVARLLPWRALTRLGLISAGSAVAARLLVGGLPPLGRLTLGVTAAVLTSVAVASKRIAPEERWRVIGIARRWLARYRGVTP